jgi:hypothetical protein
MANLTQILILGPQALHLTLALRTALGLGLAQAASDKVLAASISSTLISMLEAYFFGGWYKRLTKGAFQWRLQCVRAIPMHLWPT